MSSRCGWHSSLESGIHVVHMLLRNRLTGKLLAGLAALAFVASVGGCQDPNTGPAQQRSPQRPAGTSGPVIAKVVCFYLPPPACFLSFDTEGDPDPEGFQCTMYLLSRETGKGVHVEGTLRLKIFRVDRGPDGKKARTLVQELAVPTTELPRAKREAALGWAYAPRICWGNIDVLGSEIELLFSYESPDGRLAKSETKVLRVPAHEE